MKSWIKVFLDDVSALKEMLLAFYTFQDSFFLCIKFLKNLNVFEPCEVKSSFPSQKKCAVSVSICVEKFQSKFDFTWIFTKIF